jgi:soluble lytic murein transglycosylase-like protein
LLLGYGQGDVSYGVMVASEIAGLAETTMRSMKINYPHGGGPDIAAYPIPKWVPEGGFRTDRALIYALIRQESSFNPDAVSPAGARGLMQLMPATARFVARVSGHPAADAERLGDPELNMTLGQNYLQLLLSESGVNYDLFRLAVAWNGGPGNMERWRRAADDPADPLLYIETIPAKETRNFIEQVLANFWIYRHRLGQQAPSLDALASGAWPTFVETDDQPIQVARRGRD